MLLSKFAVCNSTKSKFIKEEKARGLLSSFGKRTSLIQIPLLDPPFFKSIKWIK